MYVGQNGRSVGKPPVGWVRTHEDLPDAHFYTLADDDAIDMHIQPGGCVEFGETATDGNRDFVHFCPETFGAILSAIEFARTVDT